MGPQVLPSAPPYVGSMREIVNDSEKPTRSSSYSASDEAKRCRDPFIKSGAVASTPLTSRFPIFHASLEQVLLESEEELLSKRSSKLVSEGVPVKPKRTQGKLKVQEK